VLTRTNHAKMAFGEVPVPISSQPLSVVHFLGVLRAVCSDNGRPAE
jgi:hypothetical protein